MWIKNRSTGNEIYIMVLQVSCWGHTLVSGSSEGKVENPLLPAFYSTVMLGWLLCFSPSAMFPQSLSFHKSYRDLKVRGRWKEDVLHREPRCQKKKKKVSNSYLSRTMKNCFSLITLVHSDYIFQQSVCNWFFHLQLLLFSMQADTCTLK